MERNPIGPSHREAMGTGGHCDAMEPMLKIVSKILSILGSHAYGEFALLPHILLIEYICSKSSKDN